MDISQLVKERDEALLSLDKKKIKAYMKKYNVSFEPENETTFWAAVHKSIISIKSATDEQRAKSYNWLIQNGFKPYIW